MGENSRNPGNPDFPDPRPIADVLRQILDEGHGRTAEQRYTDTSWSDQSFANHAKVDRTTIKKVFSRQTKSLRGETLNKLLKVAFGSETSDHELARELRASVEVANEASRAKVDREPSPNAEFVRPLHLGADGIPFADGQFYVPRRDQRGDDPDKVPVHLRLIFPGLAKVTTRAGTVVFSVTSARLNVGAAAGRIVDLNRDFDIGWEGGFTSVRAVPASVDCTVAYLITTRDPARPLAGNVLVGCDEDPYVRLFDVLIDEPGVKVRIQGRVTLDAEDVAVDWQRSSLKKELPDEPKKIRAMQAKLVRLALLHCGDGSADLQEIEIVR